MSNVFFFFILVLSVLVTLSSSSWLVCWMMMEISSFFFVPMLFGFWSVSSVMIGLKYFLIQSIGSSIFLFSVLWESFSFGGWEWLMEDKTIGVMTCLSMMIKLGVFPFSGWLIHVSENLSWKNFFLLSSVQEVIPLVMISKFGGVEELYFVFVCFSVVTLVGFCFVSYSIHWMMMVSSLFNVCWMIVASLISKESLMFFMFVYFSTLFIVFWVLDSSISLSSVAAMSAFSFEKGSKVVFLFVIFMVMGVPPLGNFLGKVEVLSVMGEEGMVWFGTFMIVMSSIFMFMYMKVSLCMSSVVKSKEVYNSGSSVTWILFAFFSVLSFFLWVF